MSNGEDVLDNWEEIDEAGLSNTLERIQAERNSTPPSNATAVDRSKQPINIQGTNTEPFTPSRKNVVQTMKLLQHNSVGSETKKLTIDNTDSLNAVNAVKSPLDEISAAFEPVLKVLHKTNDEYQSANYTQPMQTVKILRRPTQSSDRRNNDLRPKQPIKTLQQREQEYAEARLRILGSAKNPEDDEINGTPEPNTVERPYNSPTALAITTTSQPAINKAPATAIYTRTESLPRIQQQQQLAASRGVCLPSSNNRGVFLQSTGVIQPTSCNLNYQNHYHMQQP